MYVKERSGAFKSDLVGAYKADSSLFIFQKCPFEAGSALFSQG